MKKNYFAKAFILTWFFCNLAFAQDATSAWFDIFNVSNKQLPGSFYAYSITPSPGSACVSPCTQVPFSEDDNGTTPVPSNCAVANCPLSLTIFLEGKVADTSCQEIDLTNITEVWVYFNNDHFSATCQAFRNITALPGSLQMFSQPQQIAPPPALPAPAAPPSA